MEWIWQKEHPCGVEARIRQAQEVHSKELLRRQFDSSMLPNQWLFPPVLRVWNPLANKLKNKLFDYKLFIYSTLRYLSMSSSQNVSSPLRNFPRSQHCKYSQSIQRERLHGSETTACLSNISNRRMATALNTMVYYLTIDNCKPHILVWLANDVLHWDFHPEWCQSCSQNAFQIQSFHPHLVNS